MFPVLVVFFECSMLVVPFINRAIGTFASLSLLVSVSVDESFGFGRLGVGKAG